MRSHALTSLVNTHMCECVCVNFTFYYALRPLKLTNNLMIKCDSCDTFSSLIRFPSLSPTQSNEFPDLSRGIWNLMR